MLGTAITRQRFSAVGLVEEPTRTDFYVANVWFSVFDQVLSEGHPGGDVAIPLRFPHDPSASLSMRSRKVTPEQCQNLSINRYSRPLGTLSQRAVNGALSPISTITFLGEEEDVLDP